MHMCIHNIKSNKLPRKAVYNNNSCESALVEAASDILEKEIEAAAVVVEVADGSADALEDVAKSKASPAEFAAATAESDVAAGGGIYSIRGFEDRETED